MGFWSCSVRKPSLYIETGALEQNKETLLPIIEQHCIEGTIFHSDGWKAYGKLAEHLDVKDCSHFPVKHSSNYVDPETGAHTQTIEGL